MNASSPVLCAADLPREAADAPFEPMAHAPGQMARRCLQLAYGAGLFAITIGLAVLTGWVTGFRPLMTVLPGFVAMKPNTAVGLALAGWSLLLFLQAQAGANRPAGKLSKACAAGMGVIGALTLFEYATGLNLGIDELLFRDFAGGTHGLYAPGRPAPITAFNFVCLGLALFLLHFPRGTGWAHALTGCVGFTSLLAILGYFYGVTALYQSGNFTAVALHTAIGFLTLCLGVWCATSHFGFMGIVTGSGTSGMLLRRYGLVAVVVPFLFGWLRMQGEHYAWYSAALGTAIFAMANVVTFAVLIWIGASSLRTSENRETLVLESLRHAHEVLEVRVAERTTELAAAYLGLQVQMTERGKVEQDLREASRRAGMAEVATSVIHNVGNVLNSVNISATLVTDRLKRSRVDDLPRVAGLLHEHSKDLGAFLREHPQGRRLPDFLGHLGEQLTRERDHGLAELAALREHIEHIKIVVATQQSFAKVSGLGEILDVPSLVEEALRLNAGVMDRPTLRIERDYEDVPPVHLERHTVLQILVNLIQNAKLACAESPEADKSMRLQVRRTANAVQILVVDNGVGISPENFNHIFTHGFTTRQEGHGFGLHSGANAARALGGSLTASSAGPGRGATFTLELPIQPTCTP